MILFSISADLSFTVELENVSGVGSPPTLKPNEQHLRNIPIYQHFSETLKVFRNSLKFIQSDSYASSLVSVGHSGCFP